MLVSCFNHVSEFAAVRCSAITEKEVSILEKKTDLKL